MKHNFRILIGMLLFAIPLCLNAQVKPVKPDQEQKKESVEKTEKQEKPIKNLFNSEMLKISGFVQGMYIGNLDKEGKLTDNTFRMRRVRLSVEGTLAKGLTYKIQGDFSRSPTLVDAFVKYKVCNEFAIQLGQFKTPFSIESPINPLNLEIFDYGEGIQKLVGYSDICGVGTLGRDLGIMATGDLFPVKGEEGIKYHVVNYSLGLFNGNGANIIDNNNRKDLVGRLDIHPGLKNLTLSGSYYWGKYKKDDTNNGSRNRWSVGAQYNDGDLVIRAEYINGLTGYQVAAFNDTLPAFDEQGNQLYVENLRHSKGYYAEAGYNFKLGKDKSQKLMPVVRYEHYAPGDINSVVYGESNFYTVGVNYWPLKSVNFKLDYSFIQEGHVGDPGTNNKHRVVAILSYKF